MYGDDNNGSGPQMYIIPHHVNLINDFQSYFFGRKQATFPIKILECPAAKCNGPNVLYRAGTRMGGANLHMDFSFAFGVGGFYQNKAAHYIDYGFYTYGLSSGMARRYAVTNINNFGKVVRGRDYRYPPSDYAMMNDMENGTRQPVAYGDHGNKELPHGLTGVNLTYFDGHIRFVEFKTAAREINFGGRLRW